MSKFNYVFKIEKSIEENNKTYIFGACSTADVDRDNDSVDIESLDLAFQRFLSLNPVLLYNHELDRVIGEVLPAYNGNDYYESGVVGNELKIVAVLSDTAGDIKTQVEEGVLKAFSIGGRGRVLDTKLQITDLYEISVVPVGVNKDALFSVVKAVCTGKNCTIKKGDEFMVNELEMEMIVEKAVAAMKTVETEKVEVDIVKGLQETVVALKSQIEDMKGTTVKKAVVETEQVEAPDQLVIKSIMKNFYMEV